MEAEDENYFFDDFMESEEVAALNHHHIRTFIKQNYGSFIDHRNNEDEDEEFREIMYLDEEEVIRPRPKSLSGTFDIGDSCLTYKYSREGTKLKMSFELDKLATIADILITAVNQDDSSKLLILSKDVTKGGIIKCNHPQVCQTTNGFMDDSGAVTIRFQIQFKPDKPTIHSFHRHFRLQLYWFKKKKIDQVFSAVINSTTTTHDKYKIGVSDSRWERYLVEDSKDFSLNKDRFWKNLLDHCRGDHFLVDIVSYGSTMLFNEKTPQLPSIKAYKDDFLLIGSFGDLLSQALKLVYLPIHQLDAKNLTLERVMQFEERLLKNGSIVFQYFFIKSIFEQSIFQQCGEQTNPGLKMDDEGKKNISVGDEKGGNSTEEQPAGTDYDHSKPSDTKQNELGKSLDAIVATYNECLKPVKVAGVKYRESMKKIHAEYSVVESSYELEKLISEWHVTAQENAYEQFREQEKKINDADYIADQNRRKFVLRRTAKEKKANKSQEEARKIGILGEEHAYKYFTTKYKGQDLVVRWMNEFREAGHPYDLCVFEETKPKIFIEVKSTSKLGKPWFYLTPSEYDSAKEKGVSYIIAHVHINENEQDETKKYTLTEYVNPLKEGGELKLSMTRHKE